MLWLPVVGAILSWFPVPGQLITPKPCSVDGVRGTCMFVWECIKSEGRHVGMCVDTFMFGSCCAQDSHMDNIAEASSHEDGPNLLYTEPLQESHSFRPHISTNSPISSSSLKFRPSNNPGISNQKPASPINLRPTQPPRFSATTATLIALAPSHTKPVWQLTDESQLPYSINHNSIPSDSKPLAPIVTHWQITTEPGFITRIKTKPGINSIQNKPHKSKPTKKPTFYNTTNRNIIIHTLKPLISTTVSIKRKTTTTCRTTTSTMRSPTTEDLMPTSTISTMSVSESVGCGVPPLFPQPQTRIVGGRNAPFGRWPWQVSVRRTSFFGFSSTHRCGGAVLNENWIATAGHCVDDLLTSQIRIRVGEYDFSSIQEELPFVERGVAKKLVHPKYNFFTYEYDLALVKLDKSVEFAPHISPICLPASDDLLIGENATVTGWGRLSEKGTLPSVLQEVSVPIVSNDRCKNMFLRAGRHEFIPDIFMCAGHEHGGQDSCQGDSGGPLQVRGKDGRYFLAGIISWGIGCAEANLPGVCTRVSKFVPWILKSVT